VTARALRLAPGEKGAKKMEVPFYFGSQGRARCLTVAAGESGREVLARLLGPEAADDHALAERWRGVERVLPAEALIWPLWSAWGEEERSQHVKFVVKRVKRRSRPRPLLKRRGSFSSTASGEVHPRRLGLNGTPGARQQQQRDNGRSLEDMVKVSECVSGSRSIDDGDEARGVIRAIAVVAVGVIVDAMTGKANEIRQDFRVCLSRA